MASLNINNCALHCGCLVPVEGAQQISMCVTGLIKGLDYFTVTDESKVIPDPSDFSEHWIETRAGRADPKTGIPPSLYTMRITDFLHGPAQVLLIRDATLPVFPKIPFCSLDFPDFFPVIKKN